MADPATESARLAARLGRRAQRELWSANTRSACRSVERPLPREANGWKGSIAPSNGGFRHATRRFAVLVDPDAVMLRDESQ